MTYLARNFDHCSVEQPVLGACLIDSVRLDAVLSRLAPSDFAEPLQSI